MYIVASIRALAAGARERGAVIRFVRGRIFGEADVSVDTEDNVFGR